MGRDRELPPPLEMMCLNALWQIGEGNVEEVRRVVSQGKPLAYTTVLTLLDRLAKRGAVSRRKEGRGFRYQPTVARDRLRHMALQHFLTYHFDGSVGELKIFLETAQAEPSAAEEPQPVPLSVADPARLRWRKSRAIPDARRSSSRRPPPHPNRLPRRKPRCEDPHSRHQLDRRRCHVAARAACGPPEVSRSENCRPCKAVGRRSLRR